MITNYIPNTCKYNVNNLKKVVHIFSEASNKVYIDNGEAYVTGTVYDFQTISATSVSYNETTSYDDRFKFQKTVTVTVDGFVKLSALNEKYYVVLEDENGILWLVNQDFPSLVTYTYTLEDGKDDTVFTFNALSNFPTLKLNATIGNFNECKSYSLVKIENLKMLEKRYANIDASSSIIYGYSNQVYKTVKFNEGSLSLEEVFDGTNVNTSIQFSINMDDYQSSWHYNVLEYPYNKYVAVIDHLACGFEMGLVPSFNAQGSEIDGSNDTVTITLVGGSQKGSEWANSWTEVTVAPVYTWRLSKEFECKQTRWVDVEYACSGRTGYDKYLIQKEQIWDYATDDWVDTNPLITAATLVEEESEDCGYVPLRYIFHMSDGYYTGECNASSAVSQSDITNIHPATYLKGAEIGKCVTTISDNTFERTYIMTGVTIGKNVTSIGREAFYYATGLTSVEIPSGVTSIGHAAFRYCTSLNSITCLATTPPRLVAESGRQRVFEYTNNCPIYVPCGYVDTYKAASGWSTYASRIEGIPPCGQPTPTIDGKYQLTLNNSNVVSAECDSTSAITRNETSAYTGSVVSVVIGDCVTSIGMSAFDNCSTLTSVSISNSVTTIETYAFKWCTSMLTCTIGRGVTTIGGAAFIMCDSLTSITVLATTPPSLHYLNDAMIVFSNTNNCPIYVPSGSVDAYKSERGWSYYASRIQAIP